MVNFYYANILLDQLLASSLVITQVCISHKETNAAMID